MLTKYPPMPQIRKMGVKKIKVELTDVELDKLLEIIGREPLSEVYDLATTLIQASRNAE